ncbi:M15 family metallopeptidase [Paenibacillus sp.]|uniref:M15 family metallopeptidase n=1 Tax=Paenibacillus sp. TaxID=58172 RepID=UPI002811725E|nr:M15 family metallopeptidase [Paenibacillus sp.]
MFPRRRLHRLLILAIAPFFLFVLYRAAEDSLIRLSPSPVPPASATTEQPSAIPADAGGERLPYADERTAGELAVVVNKEHPLPAGYAPSDLVAPDIPFVFEGEHEKRLLRDMAAREIEKLFEAAEEDGVQLYGVSGYRSYETQKALYSFNVRTKGEAHAARYSALPGTSEHQTGLALDVSSASVDYKLVPAFADTEEGRWLVRHAHLYGFVIRYPSGKEDITGYAYEPWHLRYVGRPAALSAHTYDLTLEEMAAGAVPVVAQ